jgi:hypothetical protein
MIDILAFKPVLQTKNIHVCQPSTVPIPANTLFFIYRAENTVGYYVRLSWPELGEPFLSSCAARQPAGFCGCHVMRGGQKLPSLNMRRKYRYICAVAVCLLLSACSNIRVGDEREMSAMPPTAPRVIYVKDFELAPGRFQAESGILPISPISAGVRGAFIPRILGVPEDRAARERELLKLMSAALVDDLTTAGLNARFLPSSGFLPSEG